IGGDWQWNAYAYQAASVLAKAEMATPAPSSTLTASTVQFQWTGGAGVSHYYLDIGTTPRGTDLYSAEQGLALSQTVSNLPTDGPTTTRRSSARIGGDWQWNAYTYQAATVLAKAELATPAPSSTLTASNVQFQWTGGAGVN